MPISSACPAGGPIAVCFAALYPRRVRSLALVSTGLGLGPEEPQRSIVLAQAAILREEGADAAYDRLPAGCVASLDPLWEPVTAPRDDGEERRRALVRQVAAVPRALRVCRYGAELADLTALIAFDLRPYAARVIAPTLVLHGTADVLAPPEKGRALARAIRGAAWRTFDGEGHGMLFTNAAVRRAVIGFMG